MQRAPDVINGSDRRGRGGRRRRTAAEDGDEGTAAEDGDEGRPRRGEMDAGVYGMMWEKGGVWGLGVI